MTRALLAFTLLACGCHKDDLVDSDITDSSGGGDSGAEELCDGEDADGDGFLPCRQALWVNTIDLDLQGPGYGLSKPLAVEAVGLLEALDVGVTWTELSSAAPWTDELNDVGLLVLQGDWTLGGLTAADATALESWVNEGGSLLWLGQHPMKSSCDAVNALPNTFGVSCDNPDYSYWDGSTTTFMEHEVTEGLVEIVGHGGDKWTFANPAQELASVNGSTFVAVVEHGAGRVVFVSDEWPFYNAGTDGAYDISAANNKQLVENIWGWMVRD